MDELRSHVVHLELHTPDGVAAGEFLRAICGWESESVATARGPYTSLATGAGLSGGIVECGSRRALWVPYVRVDDVGQATERARENGADVLLAPREGPAGWRSVISSPCGVELALWRAKA